MYIKQTTKDDPYVIVVTKEEMKEAFKSPVSYELFRQAIMSLLIENNIKEREADNDK